MNLANNPTPQQLAQLLAGLDDNAASHLPWVDHQGDMHIDPIPDGLTPVGYTNQLSGRMKFRFESFHRGNGYAGRKAASSDEWVNRLYKALVDSWTKGVTGYQDEF